ncbi:MAG: hypothetical protein JXA82_18615 [Sedimentisphaerales bacterium]|nr:hypothetical protein [Sedimentisphaerales bacterium]
MKKWWKQGNAKRDWGVTLALLGFTGLTGLCVFIPVISWHSEGGGMTVTGILLSLAAGCSLVMAIVQPWRRLWKYLVLLVMAVISFFIMVWMHNIAYALREMTKNQFLLPGIFGFIDVATFLLAIILCPCLFLVGAGGGAVLSLARLRTEATTIRKAIFAFVGTACMGAIIGFFWFILTQMA